MLIKDLYDLKSKKLIIVDFFAASICKTELSKSSNVYWWRKGVMLVNFVTNVIFFCSCTTQLHLTHSSPAVSISF